MFFSCWEFDKKIQIIIIFKESCTFYLKLKDYDRNISLLSHFWNNLWPKFICTQATLIVPSFNFFSIFWIELSWTAIFFSFISFHYISFRLFVQHKHSTLNIGIGIVSIDFVVVSKQVLETLTDDERKIKQIKATESIAIDLVQSLGMGMGLGLGLVGFDILLIYSMKMWSFSLDV